MKALHKNFVYESFDYSNPLKGGKGDNLKKIDPKELLAGIETEKEHVGNINDPKNLAKDIDIVKDHEAEFPDYYTNGLIPMEEKLGEEHKNDKYGKAYQAEKKEENS
jgi:hypothetical protein